MRKKAPDFEEKTIQAREQYKKEKADRDSQRPTPKPKSIKNIYDINYNREFCKVKHIMFNLKIADDVELMEWLDSQPISKNQYLKGLIRADMEARRNV